MDDGEARICRVDECVGCQNGEISSSHPRDLMECGRYVLWFTTGSCRIVALTINHFIQDMWGVILAFSSTLNVARRMHENSPKKILLIQKSWATFVMIQNCWSCEWLFVIIICPFVLRDSVEHNDSNVCHSITKFCFESFVQSQGGGKFLGNLLFALCRRARFLRILQIR